MIVSMTGFGRSKAELETCSVTVEIKAVNHRFLEFNIRMPRQLLVVEDKIKKKIAEHVTRGRIEVFVTVEGTGHLSSNVVVDWPLLDKYVQSIKAIQNKYKLEDSFSLRDLLLREDLISIEEGHEGNPELEQLVLHAIENAAAQLKQMRIVEGKVLESDLHNQLNILSEKTTLLKKYAPQVVELYRERLRKRMEEFTNGVVDEDRMVNEIAIFADKADINEELTRLESHISQFYQIMSLTEPVGRKLDFLLQEMNREVNTIGSKGNDSSIAREVVEMKSLLEKMKEQVQNIE
ncbi:YicC family protein [Robertmurraya sp. DFI.2.37]|uniref:YicC/YloC family endoribonuclease n=1 Tax=Robertmurraya sp. DFI.2.37 TaxID=3031819 RepID=UPI00124735CD|nr:YicC/YloC family endoribonuclease [Robertmurraya sp. DFI.2.37]MDF1506643.1 YicC family protein [Robertmurraya sp. DFI.2.37]